MAPMKKRAAALDEYTRLAPVYDGMARDPAIRVLYREWRDALVATAAAHGISGRVLVDLACGTGNSAIPWSRRRGWTVIGVDRSAAMLRQARRKSRAVRWVRQDLRDLALETTVDFATCHFDALNHVLTTADLQRVFRRVARVLRPGGLFQFDLNTVHMLRWLRGREKLFRVGPHVFVAANEFDERSGVATFHQHWFVRKGRLYQRRHVAVRTRAFTDAAIRAMLDRAGFRPLQPTIQRRLDGKPVRKLYAAIRR